MDKEELLERYEVFGDERVYAKARQRYQDAVAGSPADAPLLTSYGYLQECHGRRAIQAAADCYERAITADPAYDKAHWQSIIALAALGQIGKAITRYQHMVAEAPGEPRGYRFLAAACLLANDYEQAARVIREGLDLVPDDPSLSEHQGDLYAATGHPEDALACWRRASTLAPDDYGISMHYSAADLLEREGRLTEAAHEWRFIIDWCEERGYGIAADWPKRELERLEAHLAGA
jgi:tetratricopeptide (TPR) repeat protein